MHALGLVAAVDMDPVQLTQRPADATPSPYQTSTSGRKRPLEEENGAEGVQLSALLAKMMQDSYQDSLVLQWQNSLTAGHAMACRWTELAMARQKAASGKSWLQPVVLMATECRTRPL